MQFVLCSRVASEGFTERVTSGEKPHCYLRAQNSRQRAVEQGRRWSVPGPLEEPRARVAYRDCGFSLSIIGDVTREF